MCVRAHRIPGSRWCTRPRFKGENVDRRDAGVHDPLLSNDNTFCCGFAARVCGMTDTTFIGSIGARQIEISNRKRPSRYASTPSSHTRARDRLIDRSAGRSADRRRRLVAADLCASGMGTAHDVVYVSIGRSVPRGGPRWWRSTREIRPETLVIVFRDRVRLSDGPRVRVFRVSRALRARLSVDAATSDG